MGSGIVSLRHKEIAWERYQKAGSWRLGVACSGEVQHVVRLEGGYALSGLRVDVDFPVCCLGESGSILDANGGGAGWDTYL